MTMTTKTDDKTSDKTERKSHEVQPSQVKVGDIMAFVYYARVDKVSGNGCHLEVTGLSKGSPDVFAIEGRSLVQGGLSADQYHETVVVSTTEAARMLVTSPNTPFTVCFTKKNGEERVLRGRLLGEEPLLGYSWVEDLEIMEGNRIREVNHREIKYLIVNGVKYQVKGKK
jgi:hypothetical protein